MMLLFLIWFGFLFIVCALCVAIFTYWKLNVTGPVDDDSITLGISLNFFEEMLSDTGARTRLLRANLIKLPEHIFSLTIGAVVAENGSSPKIRALFCKRLEMKFCSFLFWF